MLCFKSYVIYSIYSFDSMIKCFIITFIGLASYSTLGMTSIVGISLLIGLVSALVEAVTPLALDNITVPLLAVFLLEVFL